MALKVGASDVAALYVGASAVDAAYVGASSAFEAGGGAPEWLEDFRAANDSLPITIGDFINENYWADEAEPADATSFFTIAPTIVAQGKQGEVGDSFIGPLLEAFQDPSGYTLLVEFLHSEEDEVLDIWNSGTGFGLFIWLDDAELWFGNYTSETDEAHPAILASQINRFAVTVKAGAIVYSLNGSAPVTMTTADVVIGTNIDTINSINSNYYRVIAGYAALPDNNLAALTTLA